MSGSGKINIKASSDVIIKGSKIKRELRANMDHVTHRIDGVVIGAFLGFGQIGAARGLSGKSLQETLRRHAACANCLRT